MIENDPYYTQDNHQLKPDKKKKWIKISLSILILIMIGFLAWVFFIIPQIEEIYIQGQEDVVVFQTENGVIVYVNENSEVQTDPLDEFCQTFYGVQQ